MHLRLSKTADWDRHMAGVLREGKSQTPRNRKFRNDKERASSPVKVFARKRFQASILGMVKAVYRPEPVHPQDEV